MFFVFTRNRPEVKHITRNEAYDLDLTASILSRQGLFYKIRAGVWYNKKGQETPVKGHLECCTPLGHVVSKTLTENRVFYFSKRALGVITTNIKWLT